MNNYEIIVQAEELFMLHCTLIKYDFRKEGKVETHHIMTMNDARLELLDYKAAITALKPQVQSVILFLFPF